MTNYYKNQLNKLNLNEGKSIKFICEGKSTNYLDLNKDSLNAILEYFNNLNL